MELLLEGEADPRARCRSWKEDQNGQKLQWQPLQGAEMRVRAGDGVRVGRFQERKAFVGCSSGMGSGVRRWQDFDSTKEKLQR